jgi:hypothetical protein
MDVEIIYTKRLNLFQNDWNKEINCVQQRLHKSMELCNMDYCEKYFDFTTSVEATCSTK